MFIRIFGEITVDDSENPVNSTVEVGSCPFHYRDLWHFYTFLNPVVFGLASAVAWGVVSKKCTVGCKGPTVGL